MADNILMIDGVDVGDDYGIWISGGPQDWLSAPRAKWGVSPLTNRVGGVVSATYEVEPRRLVIPIRVDAATVDDRVTAERWLKGRFARDVTVRLDDGSTPVLQIRGKLEAIALDPVDRALSPVSRGSISLFCGDPLWQEVATTDTALSGETAIALGSAPVRHWSLAISGACENLTIVVKDGDGNTLHTLTWTGEITSETLTIDSANGVVMLDATNEFGAYTGGFPVLDPADEPTMTLTAGTGTPSATLSLKKRYW